MENLFHLCACLNFPWYIPTSWNYGHSKPFLKLLFISGCAHIYITMLNKSCWLNKHFPTYLRSPPCLFLTGTERKPLINQRNVILRHEDHLLLWSNHSRSISWVLPLRNKKTRTSRVGPYGKEKNSKSKTLIWKSCCKHITWGKYRKMTNIKKITWGRVENIRQSVETITKRQETTATAYNGSCLSYSSSILSSLLTA